MDIKPVFKLIILLGVAVLAGCASQPEKSDPQDPSAQPTLVHPVRVARPPSPYAEQMHLLLMAEFSARSKEYAKASQYYYQAARQTRDPEIAKRALHVTFLAKDGEQALRVARLWTELAPRDPDARQAIVAALLQQKETDEALRQMDKLLALLPDLPDQRLHYLLRMISGNNDQEAALRMMQKIVDKRPGDPDVLLLQARMFMAVKQFESAEQPLIQVLAREPGNPQAIRSYLHVLLQLERPEDAQKLLRDTVNTFPKRREWRLLHAQLLMEQNQNEPARRQFRKLLAATPEDPELLMSLALLNLKMERWSEARTHLRKMVKLRQQTNTARYFLGQIAEEQKQWQQATNWYRQIDQGPHRFTAQARMVGILVDQKRYQQALRLIQEIPPHDQEEEFALMAMEAEIYFEMDQGEAGLAVFDRYLKEHPQEVEIWYQRGLFADRLDRLEEMERNFRQVLMIKPEHIEAKNALGYTLADRTNRLQEALELIQAALAEKPDAYHIQDSMGWVLYRLEQYDESLRYLRKAFEQTQDPEIAAHLGEVLWVTGEKAEALSVWRDSLREYPEHPKLREAIERFNVTP